MQFSNTYSISSKEGSHQRLRLSTVSLSPRSSLPKEMNFLSLILVLFIGCVYSKFCDTFATKCTAELGKPLHNENNANVVKLDTNGKFYFTVTVVGINYFYTLF